MDISTERHNEDLLSSDSDTVDEECNSVDIFLTASKRAKRDRPVSLYIPSQNSHCQPQSLENVYADNPTLRLSNIDKNTMELVGGAVKPILLEATHESLQESVPENMRHGVWDRALSGSWSRGTEAGDDRTIPSVSTLPDKLRLHSSRPFLHLMGNCVSILTADFSTPDSKTLRLIFDRGVTLCDALGDNKRREALGKAAHAIGWLILELECKTTGVYQY